MINKTRTSNRTFFPKSWKTLAASAALAATLPACTGNDGESIVADDSGSGFAMPQALQRASFPAGGNVTAFITIDGGQREAMKVDNAVANFSKKLADGNHELFLEMFYESTSFSAPVSLVSANKTIDVGGADGNAVNFLEKDFNYTDSDGDSWTNVREIEAGSNPDSGNSVPADDDDNYEENDQFQNAYDVTGMENVMFDKSLSTGQGYVTVNDAYDVYKITLSAPRKTLEAEFLSTNGIFGGLLYLDAAGNAVVAEAVSADSGSSELRKFQWKFSNPAARDYFLLIGPGPEDTETPVAGGYFMKWFSTQ